MLIVSRITILPSHVYWFVPHLIPKLQGIEPCEVDINGDIKDYGYVLEVQYVALTWMDLVNSFEFDWLLYLVFFTAVG